VARAERHIGRSIGLGPHVLVIGDTPRDILGALTHGATPICVATGRNSSAELLEAGAVVALESFEDIDAALEALGLGSSG
jgi:phosphoglycolate phosphatase-like HAD superfamily hydrolase